MFESDETIQGLIYNFVLPKIYFGIKLHSNPSLNITVSQKLKLPFSWSLYAFATFLSIF